ncbi:MAG: helix-turn-helix domain-containing protein [Terriglobia bacterium]
MLGSKTDDIPQPCGAQLAGTRRTLNLKEAAEYLGISRSHLLNITKGKVKGVPRLQPIPAGRRLLFLPERLDQWLQEAEPKTASRNPEQVLATKGAERC